MWRKWLGTISRLTVLPGHRNVSGHRREMLEARKHGWQVSFFSKKWSEQSVHRLLVLWGYKDVQDLRALTEEVTPEVDKSNLDTVEMGKKEWRGIQFTLDPISLLCASFPKLSRMSKLNWIALLAFPNGLPRLGPFPAHALESQCPLASLKHHVLKGLSSRSHWCKLAVKKWSLSLEQWRGCFGH